MERREIVSAADDGTVPTVGYAEAARVRTELARTPVRWRESARARARVRENRSTDRRIATKRRRFRYIRGVDVPRPFPPRPTQPLRVRKNYYFAVDARAISLFCYSLRHCRRTLLTY